MEGRAAEAGVVRDAVKADEAVANEKAAAANAIKAECEADLAEAMPPLKAALKALNGITKKDIDEMKAFQNPPAVVKVVMEVICVMVGKAPIQGRDSFGNTTKDYWGASKQLLAQLDFMAGIIGFDRDHIPDATIKKIQPYLAMDDFSPKVVKRSSSACYGLCVWVRAMDVYSRVIKVVAPKRVRLKEAEADSKACTKELKAKQKVLRGVEDTLAQLQAQLAGKQAELEELQTQVQPNPNPHQP